MKKIFALLLAACLLAGLMPLGVAEGNSLSGRSLLFEGDNYVSSMAALGDTLYLLMTDGLYALAPGDEAPRLLNDQLHSNWVRGTPPPLEYLVSGGGKLYGLAPGAGMLNEIKAGAASADMLPLIEVKPFQDKPLRENLATDGQGLYAMIEGEIQRFDIENGQMTSTPAQDLLQFCLYGPGRYLAIQQKPGQGREIVSIDAAKGLREVLSPLTLGAYYSGMAYDEKSATLVIADRSSFYTWRQGEAPRYAAGFGKGDSYGLTLLPGGYAAILVDGPMLAIRAVAPGLAGQQAALLIAEEHGRTEDYKLFLKNHPDVDQNFVPFSNERIEEMFIRHMLTRDSQVDVYKLKDQNLLSAILNKGYALDMTKSPALKQLADSLYPGFRAALIKEGALLALPKESFISMDAYHVESFEKLGLTPPATWDELLDLMLTWAKDHPEGHPEYALIPGYMMTFTPEGLVKAYADWLSLNDMPIQFSTPSFKALLEKFLKVLSVYQEMPERVDQSQQTLIYSRDIPVTLGFSYLVLPFAPDTKPAITYGPDGFSYFVLNPYGQQPDKALKLMESYLAGLWPTQRLIIDSSMTQPVPNPDYERELANMHERLKMLKDRAAKAEGAEKRELEHSVTMTEEELARYKVAGRYLVHQADIDLYQGLAQYVYLNPFNPILELVADYPQMFAALTQPGADIDKFLKELDDMCRLMLLERQR